jgi:nitroreductase
MTKRASHDHPIHEHIAERWSPYGYSDQPVADDVLRSLFEAARWSPSSYNEQPWSFIVATKDSPDQYDRILNCIVEGNQGWARNAPVLAIGCSSLQFSRNGKPNTAAMHDLGAAAAHLTFEATARGLAVHQMIGIVPSKARAEFEIPEGVEPLTALAIGYAAPADSLADALKERDTAPRQRKPLAEFVFGGKWGTTASIVE